MSGTAGRSSMRMKGSVGDTLKNEGGIYAEVRLV